MIVLFSLITKKEMSKMEITMDEIRKKMPLWDKLMKKIQADIKCWFIRYSGFNPDIKIWCESSSQYKNSLSDCKTCTKKHFNKWCRNCKYIFNYNKRCCGCNKGKKNTNIKQTKNLSLLLKKPDSRTRK